MKIPINTGAYTGADTKLMLSAHQRSQITNIISYIHLRAHKHRTWAKQHTQTMQRVRVRSRRGCELFCPEKFVPLVALSFQHACCTSRCNPFTWVVVFGFCFVCARRLRPNTFGRVKRERDIFFLLSCSFSIAIERYTAFVLHEKWTQKERTMWICDHLSRHRHQHHRCRSPSRCCCCFCWYCRLTQVHGTMNVLFVAFRLLRK